MNGIVLGLRCLFCSFAISLLSSRVYGSDSNITCLHSITITRAPESGGGEDDWGTIYGVANYTCDGISMYVDWSTEYSVVLWSVTDDKYVQPWEDDYYTAIEATGDWSAQIHLGSLYEAWLVEFEDIDSRVAVDTSDAYEDESGNSGSNPIKISNQLAITIGIILGGVFGLCLCLFIIYGLGTWISKYREASEIRHRANSRRRAIDEIEAKIKAWDTVISGAYQDGAHTLKSSVLKQRSIESFDLISHYYKEVGNNVLTEDIKKIDRLRKRIDQAWDLFETSWESWEANDIIFWLQHKLQHFEKRDKYTIDWTTVELKTRDSRRYGHDLQQIKSRRQVAETFGLEHSANIECILAGIRELVKKNPKNGNRINQNNHVHLQIEAKENTTHDDAPDVASTIDALEMEVNS